MLTLPRCPDNVDRSTHTRGSTGGGDLSEPIELMNNSIIP